jgi:putative phosphonate metabolism protein
MVTALPRYAVYFVPAPETDLYRFGAATLGYDCYTGEEIPAPSDTGLSASEWAALTAEPRAYGFHATLKAPFHLRPECREADLVDELRRFAANVPAAPAFVHGVSLLGGFVAIVPRQASPGIDRLAAKCVTVFDRFRAPVTEEDRARRMRARLTDRQLASLDRWGYPYVLDDFRFHMTLTGRVEACRRGVVLELLRHRFAALHQECAVAIDRLALVRQDTPAGRFRVLHHVPIPAVL